ncbi:MAG: histidine phosphatase family protein [Granulosicoccus sp.]
MLLHLIRHGQTSWNAEQRIQGRMESELDDTGRQQAIERGAALQSIEFDAVYSSSSIRARQTTELILNGSRLQIHYRDNLREMSLGEWEGQLWPDVLRKDPEAVARFRAAEDEFSAPGAETFSELQARGVAAIESVIAETGEGEILVVSHGAILKRILAKYSHTKLSKCSELPSLPNCSHCIIQANGASRQVVQIDNLPIAETPWAS